MVEKTLTQAKYLLTVQQIVAMTTTKYLAIKIIIGMGEYNFIM